MYEDVLWDKCKKIFVIQWIFYMKMTFIKKGQGSSIKNNIVQGQKNISEEGLVTQNFKTTNFNFKWFVYRLLYTEKWSKNVLLNCIAKLYDTIT